MDKEILRIVIIATGLLIVLVMLAWAYLKDKKAREDHEIFGDEIDVNPDPSLIVDNDDDFDVVPVHTTKAPISEDNYFDDEDHDTDWYGDDEAEDQQPRLITPAIIQFSIITKADEDFNGADLVNAFNQVGLEYGSLKIFERLDANRLVDFGVACMVEPGTFPDHDLESFYCPGIVFFMQPEALDDAQAVFDDYVETIKLLAEQLDGVILDHRRQPLTDATVTAIRQSL
ncbi:MAG: cell division protein ZipA C-terminal FtsZ-binding domain-containing protein [Methylococcaceae bacterium]|jgi:cell division protein ZipA|nr:cell division protein ZipA C-terminal FtsZ-binding domain-containing protein [Methylococcaceae bacterium]MDZ4155811.1 cell division protein ZipA C-terminal FtsZ-binding domain-containing protein [Methylococcales bacterium]MDP2391840.1 cell division protein ZipA C-terminal FtsZ-binding domain-containing protein [Methylococcaceae bacterium]MDP3018921.1 cell division protein ZipA C-terminal FtsZ-binding domain-containing protein [Methylococcaceae bacterium]MDP3391482.1 cell division protein Zip